ncbi:Sulfite exporter TauE/SafE [Hartmannibacter diazotrophicus]|uniref:Probable membrane transporter protein n=1 Tax=Hartmannibacter diazotrophicus TaxID=1482074 RepID=A0A2C9D946_9HYPH|nr:sulfite exporter TauE/SafE family protein [Hartmannibacter diazotrophicus]SON56817.1 Sulfite exporter TauE/SafE [Hartmannibacter diazotrophicus]
MALAVAAFVTVLAAAFRGITGYGYALIAALGLAAFLAPTELVPLILVNDLAITVLILLDRKHGAVDWSVAGWLLAAGFAGAIVGGTLSGFLDEATARMLIAAVVLVAALVALVREPPAFLASRGFGVAIGFVVGVALGAFGVGGPLIAAWILAGGTKRQAVRGTLAVFFGAVDLFGIATHAALGHIGSELFTLLLFCLPLTLAGYGIGYVVHKRLSPAAWHRISTGGLVAIALVGAIQTAQLLIT